MSGSSSCVLTHIHISQVRRSDSCLFRDYSQSIVKHRINGFSAVNDADYADFFFFFPFWNPLAFSRIQWMVAIFCLVPLSFPNIGCTSTNSWFTYYWRILSITLLICEMSTIVWYFECSLASPFFVIGMKTGLFHPLGQWWVFQIWLYMKSVTQFNSFMGMKSLSFYLKVWFVYLSGIYFRFRFGCFITLSTYNNSVLVWRCSKERSAGALMWLHVYDINHFPLVPFMSMSCI